MMRRGFWIREKERTQAAAAATVLLFLSACAGDPIPPGRTPARDFANPESELAPGFRIELKHTNFFTLMSPLPNGNSCAGDAKTYFHPFNIRTPNASVLSTSVNPATYEGPDAYAASIGSEQPAAFAEDALNNGISHRPSFLKNVSVDITDANAASSLNYAVSCSLASTPSSPPASNCATFDYGAIGGVPTDMGGTLLLAGGVRGQNFAGYASNTSNFKGPALSCGTNGTSASTNCRDSVFALKVDALPASAGGTDAAPGAEDATESISMFTKIVSSDLSSSASTFQAVAGASAAYNSALKRALIFGGSTTYGAGGFDTDLTQVFDVTTQKWIAQTAPAKVLPTTLTTIYDSGTGPTGTSGTYTPTVYGISKLPGAKSEFGYAAVPFSAIETASVDGLYTEDIVDTTDRLYSAAGVSTTDGSAQSAYRINPTFGPEVADISNYSTLPAAPTGYHAAKVLQWPDSSPVTLLSHIGPTGSILMELRSSPTGPTDPPTPEGSAWNPPGQPSKIVNFGMAPAIATLDNGAKRGIAVLTAGFDQSRSKIGFGYLNADPSHALSNGVLATYGPAGLVSTIGEALGIPTTRDEGHRLRPLELTPASGANIPWLGGSSLIPGASKNPSSSQLLYIGGSRCRGYLWDSTLVSADDCFAPAASYDPDRDLELDATAATPILTDNTSLTFKPRLPNRAGMAVARGLYNGTTPVVLAFGGSQDIRGLNTAGNLVYGWRSDTEWVEAAVASPAPPVLTDAAMVYSHVTGKFYLFGGMVSGGASTPSDTVPRNELWELTITNFSAGPSNLTVSWRQLNPTCYPNCPLARKSHRMVEVNYNNVDPEAEPVCTVANAPCSFGIFMEGGSSDQLGLTILGDRWMFDPTANPPSSSGGGGPEGHWQRVDFMPPRRHAAMASYSYTLPFSGQLVHRALLFGGETSLSNPSRGRNFNYFVAPTLGDTLMYDFQANTWTRVKLLGQGANQSASWLSSASRFDLIQTFRIALASPFTFRGWVSGNGSVTDDFLENPNLRYFTPPPLAGATMVTRTFPQAIGSTNLTVSPLAIPEVFLFGGRKKDGKFYPLNHVWKFCTASPGERPAASASDSDDRAQCDSYNESNTVDSVSPTSELSGRWLYKNPRATPVGGSATWDTDSTPFAGSYLGSGTYDPVHDRILLLGGLTGSSAQSAASGTALEGQNTILEYTPPSKTRPSEALCTGSLCTTAAASATNASYRAASVNGSWREVRNCPRTDGVEPVARFGHSLSYDALNGQLILVGGQRANHLSASEYQGQPLTQEVFLSGRSVDIPEVWTARYVEDDLSFSDSDYSLIDRSGGSPGPCYLWKRKTTFGNSQYIESQQPLEGSLTFAASTFIPSGGYNTGYYSMFDSACSKQGPINTNDTSISKLLAGGVYIDIDRSRMGRNENLVLNVTFIALGPDHQRPDGARFDPSEAASLKVHLIRTGLSLDAIQSTLQPRHLTYSSLETYPQVVDTLALLAPPASGLRQEQIVLPVSANSLIDRIRIERYSGSAILIDAAVFRTQKAEGGTP